MLSLIYRYIPAIESTLDYSWDTFRRDLFAGTTVAAVAVPQAIAYAMIFGMPAEYGLYTAIVMTVVGSLLASSKQLINGPTNVISLAMLSALSAVPSVILKDRWIEAAILMAFLVGCLQTAIALMRLGDLSRYISHAVIVGFTAGASVLLILDQLKNALGLSEPAGLKHAPFLKRFWVTMTEGGSMNWVSLAIAVGTIAVTLGLRSVNRKFKIILPDLLLAIVVSGFVVWLFGLGSGFGVKLVDKVPPKLPGFGTPLLDFELIRSLAGSATAIALLGMLEAIAMSKSLAARSHQKLDINQQCLSEGVANLAGSFFHCFPGSGSLTRSYINYQAGAATQWSGVICAAMVALTIIGLAPLAQFIPKAALAGVLLLTATRMIDLPDLLYHIRATRFDAIIVVATALAAVFVSIEYCILIGVLLSFLFYVPKAAKVSMTELIVTSQRVIRERMPNDPKCAFIKVYNFEGELFFGSSPDFEEQLERIESEVKPMNGALQSPNTSQVKVVLLRLKHVRNLDAVCLHLLGNFLDRLQSCGIKVGLTGIRDDVFTVLDAVGIVEKLGATQVFRENQQLWSATMGAVSWAYEQIGTNRCSHCAHGASLKESDGEMFFMI